MTRHLVTRQKQLAQEVLEALQAKGLFAIGDKVRRRYGEHDGPRPIGVVQRREVDWVMWYQVGWEDSGDITIERFDALERL